MRHQLVRFFALSAAALALASTAGAQGNSHKDKDKDKGKSVAHVRNDGVIVRDGRDGYHNAAKVPPGLAKKPGQMPPGQYKKRYGTNEGADVLGGVLRRRGYTVQRIVPAGDSRYVYYLSNGVQRRAIVSPGTDRLSFTNVPASLLREVLAALY